MTGPTPAQAASGEPPALYARWYRIDAANATNTDVASAWRMTFPADREFWTALDSALASAKADRNAARNAVCKLLDLFGAPDERLMQHASVTRATLLRYAGEAGVRLDGLKS